VASLGLSLFKNGGDGALDLVRPPRPQLLFEASLLFFGCLEFRACRERLVGKLEGGLDVAPRLRIGGKAQGGIGCPVCGQGRFVVGLRVLRGRLRGVPVPQADQCPRIALV